MTAPALGYWTLDMPLPPHWQRRARLGALTVAVAALHAWFISTDDEPLGRSAGRPPAIQVVALPAATAPKPAAEIDKPPAESAAVQPIRPALPRPSPARPLDTVTPPAPAPRAQIDWTAGPQPPEAVSDSVPPPAGDAAGAQAPQPGPVAGAQDDDGGGHPPLYLTRLPAQSFQLDYRVERGDDGGTGRLIYEIQDGMQYRAHFFATAADRQVFDWSSRGGFDRAGFSPVRMAERQRGIEVRAVNFQRDKGVISFSSSSRAWALAGGAQDRLSVLLQLAAIAGAEPGGLQAGQHIRVQVGTVRGLAEDWVFEVNGVERIEPAGQAIQALHLTREPTQPYDQRVELWLARDAGYLPVGLRLTQLPGRNPPEALWLSSPLPPLAPASAAPARP